jgi:hypothetical protein
VEFRLYHPECPAGLGSCGHAVLVADLCVWLFNRDGVLFCVPSSLAVVVILARTALDWVIHQGALLLGFRYPDGVWVGRGVSEVMEAF